jgi:1,4-dihydroxy-2-naphthoate octaprenyltransferase
MTRNWIRAFRLRTLPLTFASIGLGSFIAASDGLFRWDIFLLSLTTAIFLQILSNLANDYGDTVHGADHTHRVGPKRTVQSGEISKGQMKNAVILFCILSFVSGTLLLYRALAEKTLFIAFFILGIAAIWAAVRYTTGVKPYGYAGFGDPAVFFFFGLVGVGGSYFLHGEFWDPSILLPATSLGLLSVAVLNVNNLRDIESDRDAGKYSIPVRLGKKGGVQYHWSLLLISVTIAIIYTFKDGLYLKELIFLILLPFWAEQAVGIWKNPPDKLDPYLRKTAFSTLAFSILFGMGQLLQ